MQTYGNFALKSAEIKQTLIWLFIARQRELSLLELLVRMIVGSKYMEHSVSRIVQIFDTSPSMVSCMYTGIIDRRNYPREQQCSHSWVCNDCDWKHLGRDVFGKRQATLAQILSAFNVGGTSGLVQNPLASMGYGTSQHFLIHVPLSTPYSPICCTVIESKVSRIGLRSILNELCGRHEPNGTFMPP